MTDRPALPDSVIGRMLDAEGLRELGIPAPWAFGIGDRVRFSELDALNHVNHTAYLTWFESFRIPYFRAYGLSNYAPGDVTVVVRRAEVDYLREMHLAETYVVTGRTASMRRSSFTMDYAVWAPDLRAAGRVVIVLLDESGRKTAIPAAARSAFAARDSAAEESQ